MSIFSNEASRELIEVTDEKRYLAVFNLLGLGTVGRVQGATQY